MTESGICSIEGCTKPRHNRGMVFSVRLGYMTRSYRKVCYFHHVEKLADDTGLTSTQWSNRSHPYLKHRKMQCENRDGHITGHKCRSKIEWDGQLDVHHKDKNHENNDPANLETLCKNCHALAHKKKAIKIVKSHLSTLTSLGVIA